MELFERRFTPQETAQKLGVSVNTLAVWRSTKRHGLPYVKVGGKVYYRQRDLDDWLKARTTCPVEPTPAALARKQSRYLDVLDQGELCTVAMREFAILIDDDIYRIGYYLNHSNGRLRVINSLNGVVVADSLRRTENLALEAGDEGRARTLVLNTWKAAGTVGFRRIMAGQDENHLKIFP